MSDAAPSYAGIGSRETPPQVCKRMREWGAYLAGRGWTLRSGAADGADSAFEAGALSVGGQAEIYLPWAGFQGHLTGLPVERFATFGKAIRLAADFHPAWARLTKPQRSLMARNCYQLLGRNLKSPVTFVLCWAPKPRFMPDGRVVDVNGGTGLAVRLAASMGIPVYHLDDAPGMQSLRNFMRASRCSMLQPSASMHEDARHTASA